MYTLIAESHPIPPISKRPTMEMPRKRENTPPSALIRALPDLNENKCFDRFPTFRKLC